MTLACRYLKPALRRDNVMAPAGPRGLVVALGRAGGWLRRGARGPGLGRGVRVLPVLFGLARPSLGGHRGGLTGGLLAEMPNCNGCLAETLDWSDSIYDTALSLSQLILVIVI